MQEIITSRLIKTDRNGSKHYEGMVTCPRCGGMGGCDAWKLTGWTCYECGGKGQVYKTWIERTPEYEAKLEAKRQARIAKRQAEYEANAEFYRQKEIKRDCENVCKGLNTCWNIKGRQCETCEHRFYCNLLSNAIESIKTAKENDLATDEQIAILDRLVKVDTEEPVRIETLDGEPCYEGKWFDNAWGSSTRCIIKPNGEKVYTSATTDRGLAKHGLRYRQGA